MLTIRQLYISMSLGFVLLMIAGMVLVRMFWFFPAEQEHALQVQQSELNGLLAALDLRASQLEATTHDYASWDDSYEYALRGNEDYIESNFFDGTYDSLGLTGAVIVSTDNHIIYSGYYDGETVSLDNEQIDRWVLTAGTEFFADEVKSGYQVIGNKAYLIASSPVTPSAQNSPISGWMIFLQHVDVGYLDVLANVARLKLRLMQPPYQTGLEDLRSPVVKLSANRYGCIYDELRQPSLCTQISHSNGAGPAMLSAPLLLIMLLLCLIPALAFLGLLKIMVDPIRKATQLLERSNFEQTLRPVMYSTPIRIQELHQLRNAYNELIHTVRQQQARLEQLSNTDRLTNMPNRRAFDEALETTWRRILRHPQSIALVVVDIDYFKRFNDHYGHQSGDHALHRVAQALLGCARRADEMAARFGGEEFALILQIEDAQHLESVRRHIREAIRLLNIHHEYSSVAPQMTVSYGIAWIRNSGPWLEKMGKDAWLRAADSALYEAKASGRNCSMLQVLSPGIPLTESPVLKQSYD